MRRRNGLLSPRSAPFYLLSSRLVVESPRQNIHLVSDLPYHPIDGGGQLSFPTVSPGFVDLFTAPGNPLATSTLLVLDSIRWLNKFQKPCSELTEKLSPIPLRFSS